MTWHILYNGVVVYSSSSLEKAANWFQQHCGMHKPMPIAEMCSDEELASRGGIEQLPKSENWVNGDAE